MKLVEVREGYAKDGWDERTICCGNPRKEKSKEEQVGLKDTAPLLALLCPPLSTTVCTTSKHAQVKTRTIFNTAFKLIFLHVHTGCTSVYSLWKVWGCLQEKRKTRQDSTPWETRALFIIQCVACEHLKVKLQWIKSPSLRPGEVLLIIATDISSGN